MTHYQKSISEIIKRVNKVEENFNFIEGKDNRGSGDVNLRSAKIFQAIDKIVIDITGCELHRDYELIGRGADYTVFELGGDHVIKIANLWNYECKCPTRYRIVDHPLFLKPVAVSDNKLVVIQEKGTPTEMTKEEAKEINESVKETAKGANFPLEEMDIHADNFVIHNHELRSIDC